jgi:hypothetical protein
MAPLYSLKSVDDGWLIYNVFTREVLVLEGRVQSGLAEEQAESIVRRLNYIAVEQLVSPTAKRR